MHKTLTKNKTPQMKKFLYTSLISLIALTGYGQQDLSLVFLREVGQHNFANPAFQPEYQVNVGLPIISSNYIGLSNSGFSYNDVISKENGSLYLNLDNLVGTLDDKNYFEADANVDLLHLSFRTTDRLFLSFNLSARTHKSAMYPGDLVDFIVAGNEPFIGEQLNVSPTVESFSFAELGFGASYKLTDRFTVGGKLKLLGGIENATTNHAELHLQTEADTYHLTAVANASLLTSNFQRMDEDGFDLGNLNFMNNLGFAVDLGATFQASDRLQLGISVLDLGSIKWKENLYEYYLDPAQANYTFEGSPINDLFKDGEAPYNAIIDTIQDNFEFQERTTSAYSTSLPVKSYLTGNYQISNSLSAGAAIFMQHYQDRWKSGLGLNLTKQFGRVLTTSFTYSMREDTYNNFGGGISLNLKPVQFYLVSDNLLNAVYHGVTDGKLNGYINNAQSMNLRFGINLVFGQRERQPVPSSLGEG